MGSCGLVGADRAERLLPDRPKSASLFESPSAAGGTMPAIYEQYSEELRSEFDYLSTWLPNAHIELGDVGNLHRDRFERLSSVADLGLRFEVRDRERGIDLDYSSADSVGVSVQAGAGRSYKHRCISLCRLADSTAWYSRPSRAG